MFEQILQAVKEHIGNDPHLSAAIPAEHTDAVHEAIATHIHETMQGQTPASESTGGLGNLGGLGNIGGGILSNIENSLASGGIGTSAITGGLVGALTGKLGLSPAITGAIAAALPGLLQKLTQKNNPAS
ncbi:MAG TPA: hypothetical protein VHD83_11700 [Puia sp.]|nr:hypothetical protein [Puia sp.]